MLLLPTEGCLWSASSKGAPVTFDSSTFPLVDSKTEPSVFEQVREYYTARARCEGLLAAAKRGKKYVSRGILGVGVTTSILNFLLATGASVAASWPVTATNSVVEGNGVSKGLAIGAAVVSGAIGLTSTIVTSIGAAKAEGGFSSAAGGLRTTLDSAKHLAGEAHDHWVKNPNDSIVIAQKIKTATDLLEACDDNTPDSGVDLDYTDYVDRAKEQYLCYLRFKAPERVRVADQFCARYELGVQLSPGK